MTSSERKGFQGRALTALLMAINFLLAAVSGLVLFFAPGGRRAYQQDWAWLGLSKSEWVDVHIVFCLLFIIVGLCHIGMNRKPLMNYLGRRAPAATKTARKPFVRPEVIVALIITILLFAGTMTRAFPLSYIWDLRTSVRGAPGGGYHGNRQEQPQAYPEKAP